MLSPPQTSSESDAPPALTPRRPGWVRRHKFATFVVALLAAMLALRLTWGWYCDKELAAAWDEVRRRGEPTTPEDLAVEQLPDRDNAWIAYAQAIAAMKPGIDSPRNSPLEYSTYPPFGPKWHALAAASEQGNAAAFPIARRARGLPRSWFPGRLPHVDTLIPQLNDARRLAGALSDGALYTHQEGNDAETIERLLDVMHLARSVRQDPALVSQLIGASIGAIGVNAAQQIVPTLNLEPSAGGTPASEAQARALIAAMVDERESRETFAQSLHRERIVMRLRSTTTARGTWAIRPLVDRTTLRNLQRFEVFIAASERPSIAEARIVLSNLPVERWLSPLHLLTGYPVGSIETRHSRWFENYDPSGFSRALEMFHRASADRRATAMIVAARLYRHDHGRWPDGAAALAPKYLDALPADPFRADGGPLGYVLQKGTLPNGGDRPLVYFEGGEPGGKLDVIDTEPMYGWQSNDPHRQPGEPRREFRQYRDVSLWTPTTRRTVEYNWSIQGAIDNHPDEPEAPGDDSKQDDEAGDPADQ